MAVDIEGEEDNVDEALLYTFRNKEYPTETNGVTVTKVHRSLFSSARFRLTPMALRRG